MTIRGGSQRPGEWFALLLLFALICVPAFAGAQSEVANSSPAALRFETVAIRPHKFAGDEPSNRQVLPGGRFVATATSVRTLLRIAFMTDDNRLVGAPKWVDDELFDINGVIENRAEVKSPEQFQQLILSLLEDRFQLRFHREKKEGAVYWLVVEKPGRLGPRLKTATAGAVPNMSINSNGQVTTMKATRASMADVAAALRRQAGRPVEDHTELKGMYDFEIRWSPDERPDATEPALPTVLKEQLGLKLRPERGTIEEIAIDQISQPTAN